MLIYLSMIDIDSDRSEFERIYQQHGEKIFRKTLYILRNQQDTEDVMQEVWIKVAKNIALFRDKDDAVVFAYIMKIASNQAMSFFRKNKVSEVTFSEEEIDTVVCDDTIFSQCEQVEIEEISACFSELPEIYRDVLSLYFFHQHSTEQIAKLLDLNPSTVGSRLTRGRKKLIQLLERRGIHDA